MILKKFQSIKPNQKEPLYCTACGEQTPIESCGNGPNNGLHLTGFSGYYGGFTDWMPYASQDDLVTQQELFQTYNDAWFCHSCCVKLFAVFPNLASAVGIRNKNFRSNMHHPTQNDIPCCNYCWKVERSPYIEDDFIEYVPQYNPITKQLQWKQV